MLSTLASQPHPITEVAKPVIVVAACAAQRSVGAVIAIAVIVVLSVNTSMVLDVFGVWAVLSGLLQLATAIRRWKRFGAQWAMILSGGQSALAGAFFIAQAHASVPPAIVKVAGYAGVGAIYFLVSALWLSAGQLRRKFASTH